MFPDEHTNGQFKNQFQGNDGKHDFQTEDQTEGLPGCQRRIKQVLWRQRPPCPAEIHLATAVREKMLSCIG